jgi:Flp pilus assembly protein TadD
MVGDAFNGLVERAVDALLRRRLSDAYELFAEAAALRPEDARVRVNLDRLGRLGYSGASR